MKKQDTKFIAIAKKCLFDNIVVHGKVHLLARFIQSEIFLRDLQWRISIVRGELHEE